MKKIFPNITHSLDFARCNYFSKGLFKYTILDGIMKKVLEKSSNLYEELGIDPIKVDDFLKLKEHLIYVAEMNTAQLEIYIDFSVNAVYCNIRNHTLHFDTELLTNALKNIMVLSLDLNFAHHTDGTVGLWCYVPLAKNQA